MADSGKVRRALEIHLSAVPGASCHDTDCPYKGDGACLDQLDADCLDVIVAQETEIRQLKNDLETMKKSADLMQTQEPARGE